MVWLAIAETAVRGEQTNLPCSHCMVCVPQLAKEDRSGMITAYSHCMVCVPQLAKEDRSGMITAYIRPMDHLDKWQGLSTDHDLCLFQDPGAGQGAGGWVWLPNQLDGQPRLHLPWHGQKSRSPQQEIMISPIANFLFFSKSWWCHFDFHDRVKKMGSFLSEKSWGHQSPTPICLAGAGDATLTFTFHDMSRKQDFSSRKDDFTDVWALENKC